MWGLLLAACASSPPPVEAPPPPPPDVLFVVLDTVRADHLSACGYGRPTSPELERLVARGARLQCDAISPASWTLPTHATWFTGELLPEHHFDSTTLPDWSDKTLLGEHLAADGYATALVTANPVLKKAKALARGFERVDGADEIDQWRGRTTIQHVRRMLDRLGADAPDAPWFLTVNVMDAHDPWPAIGDDLGWAPPRAALDYAVKDPRADRAYHRFLRGELDAPDAFLAHVTDVYDQGIHHADRVLGRILVAHATARPDRDLRLVVTSDHGEFLGEHGLLRHGGWTWEPVTRVPLLVFDTRAGQTPDLGDTPRSTAAAYDLVRGLPLRADRPTVAFSSASKHPSRPGANTVAVWSDAGRRKDLWRQDAADADPTRWRYDLAADPGEAAGVALDEAPTLAPWVGAYQEHVAWRTAAGAANDDVEKLEALGYLDPAPEVP